jgi:DNA polymerase III subunit epsilon
MAAVAVDDDLCIKEEFEAKVWFDERRASRATLELTRYDRARWAKQALRPKQAGEALAAFLRRHRSITLYSPTGEPYSVARLAAHNAGHDGTFLQTWFRRQRLYLPAHPQVLCTLARSLWYFEERPELPRPADFRLTTLCAYFGVPFSEREAHDALADARATAALYGALVGVDIEKTS